MLGNARGMRGMPLAQRLSFGRRRLILARWFRHPLALYVVLATVGVAVLILTVAPMAGGVVERWSRRDVETRSRLIFNSIRDRVTEALNATSSGNLVPFFERLAGDERLLALGFCSDGGRLQFATRHMPKGVRCETVARAKTQTSATIRDGTQRLLAAAFPINPGSAGGHLLILHDLGFIDERVARARSYTAMTLVGVIAGIGLLATVFVLGLLRSWSQLVRSAIDDARRGVESSVPRASALPINAEMWSLLSEFRMDRKDSDGTQVQWSPQTLHRLLGERLPGTEVIAISNREPYIHNFENGSISLQIPASGLVAALEPVMRACRGKWIAHGSGTADRDTVDGHDRIEVPPGNPAYTLRRVWLTEEEQEGYYYGFSNEGLWPLCHIAFVRPTFRQEDWHQYIAINQRFADVVVEEATSKDPVVLVHDYHFALLPRLIRQRLPNATILTFWHIPWPNSETFGICPWREQVIDGLLGSTILGFH